MKPSRIRDRERPAEEEPEEEGRPSLAFRLGRAVGRGLRGARSVASRGRQAIRRRSGRP